MPNIPVPIIDSGDYNYGAQFVRGDQVYAIRHDTTDDGYQDDPDRDPDSYQVVLVELLWDGDNWRSGDIAETADGRYVVMGFLPQRIAMFYNGDLALAWDAFLNLVNEFLGEDADQGNTFPANGTVTERVNWYLENTQNIGGRAVVVGI